MDVIKRVSPKIKGKKVIAYGADVTGLMFLGDAEKEGIEVAYVVDGNKQKQGMSIFGKQIRSPYELMYEEKEDVRIVLCAPAAKDAIIQNLIQMGFVESEHIVTEYCDRSECSHLDALLGISRGKNTIVDMNEGGIPKEKTVLVLGGSTSDPFYDGIHSWSYYLQQLLNENNCDMRVLCGAVIGYTTSQELLCLLRDGLPQKPQIVISYTGYNDFTPAVDLLEGERFSLVGRNLYDQTEKMIRNYKKTKDLPPYYYGEKINDLFGNFLFNVRTMHAVCEEFGARYYAVFQPMLKNQKNEDGSIGSRMMEEDFIKKIVERFDGFCERLNEERKKYPYIYDFTSMFKDETDIFVDSCHVSEKGNRIIAEKVWRMLERSRAL